MPLRWYIDEFTARRISGWIDDDGRAAAISIVVNGQAVFEGQAADYRQDLQNAGIGDGHRAFSFPIFRHLLRDDNLVTLIHDQQVLQSVNLRPVNEDSRISAVLRALGPSTRRASDILFLQTADANKYRPMLEITSRTIIEYCSRRNLSCELYIGICRGNQPWHATFNRIVLLRRLLNSGFAGWVCYLDADAYITDLDFDIRHYLRGKDDIAMVIATDDASAADRPFWAVNAGTFLINLGHPLGQEIVYRWADRFDDVSDAELLRLGEWTLGFDDQGFLSDILRELPGGEAAVLTLRDYPNLINYSRGLFISQILRADHRRLEERERQLRVETDRVLSAARRKDALSQPR